MICTSGNDQTIEQYLNKRQSNETELYTIGNPPPPERFLFAEVLEVKLRILGTVRVSH
jgi:hypothetical protein